MSDSELLKIALLVIVLCICAKAIMMGLATARPENGIYVIILIAIGIIIGAMKKDR